ncbi:MAG: VacJ family lipoprotein [Gammaproteobacteria bacterium]|nr:VacJ family lipoprotein [Gammaproteobacteria bacterium]
MEILHARHTVSVLMLVGALAILGGCATGPQAKGLTSDPLEPANRAFYGLNEGLDRGLVKPIAEVYEKITPAPARTAVTNFFDNLLYLNVILNSFLQGKVDQGFSDAGRFLVNSTLGIGGLFDVAKGMGMPMHNEDFGQTLATWGLREGPYVYLPIKGPNSGRDLPDLVMSTLLNPLTYLSGGILAPIQALRIINLRANLLDETRIRDEAAVDPYSFTREAYLQRREFLIYDGAPPTTGYEDIFEEEPDSDAQLKVE